MRNCPQKGVGVTVTVGVAVAVSIGVAVAVGVRVGVAVSVAVTVGVSVGVGVGAAQVPAEAFLTRNLLPSPVPLNVMQYVCAPPLRLRTISIDAGPFGTAKGSPLAITLSKPDFTLAIFTTDGPPGALAFLYLKSVAEPFALHRLAGRAKVTGPLPSSKLTEESAPVTGSEPAMLMLVSFESRTIFPALTSSFFPVMPWSVACASRPAKSRKTDRTAARQGVSHRDSRA